MTDIEKYIIWLSQFNLSKNKIENILSLTDNFDIANFYNIRGLDKFLRFQDIEDMKTRATVEQINSYFSSLEEQNVVVITYKSVNYPKVFDGIKQPPAVLYCKGDISLLDKFAISIVGTRTPSNYGRIVTDEFAGELARNNIVVVSGLAYGIDSIAHRKALEVGGKTIAVLGGGFNRIYPKEHTSLAQEIAQKGLLVSEYAPHISPTKYSFVDRNRLIALFSKGVLITEAGLKSGTRSTKEYALEYGRDVFAVPGSIKSENSVLPNLLISSGQAKCVVSAKDILYIYGIKPINAIQEKMFNDIEEKIVNLLKNGEKDLVYLQENTGLGIKDLIQQLSLLEIRGMIKKLPGNYYTAE